MDWDPLVLDEVQPINTWQYAPDDDHSIKTVYSSGVGQKDSKVTSEEWAMLSQLRPFDVLLGGHKLCEHVSGTTHYRKQVREFRPLFLQRRDPNIRLSIVRNILQNVWVEEGRFLEYHPDRGIIVLLSNKDAAMKIARDLRQGLRHKKVPQAVIGPMKARTENKTKKPHSKSKRNSKKNSKKIASKAKKADHHKPTKRRAAPKVSFAF